MKQYKSVTIRDKVDGTIAAHIEITDEAITCLCDEGYDNTILLVEQDGELDAHTIRN